MRRLTEIRKKILCGAFLACGLMGFMGPSTAAAPFVRADANDDGALDISDAITVLSFLYEQGMPIPAPAGVCRSVRSASSVRCRQ